jgi:hypothetical protein
MYPRARPARRCRSDRRPTVSTPTHERSAGNTKLGKVPFQNDPGPLALIREGDELAVKLLRTLGGT